MTVVSRRVPSGGGHRPPKPRGTPPASGSPVQDTAVHPLPYPKPTLPAAGGTFTDPTFGSTLIRVTDATSAPSGIIMWSDVADMMWNNDNTLFTFNVVGSGYVLFQLNRTTRALTTIGGLTNAKGPLDGAQWHPTESGTLFHGDLVRSVYKFTGLPANPTQTPTLVHDFTPQIPGTGFMNSRIGLSDTGRYLAVLASSFGSGDQYNYVSIYDIQSTSIVGTLSTEAQFGAGVYLHSTDWIPGDTYIRLGGTGSGFGSAGAAGSVFWNWGANTFSTSVTANDDNFSAHKSFGVNTIYNPAVGAPGGPGGDTWLTRSAATPHSWSTLLTYPLRQNTHTYIWDQHGSDVLAGGVFSDDPQVPGGANPYTWTLHSGAIWKVAAFSTLGTNAWAAVYGVDTMWYSTSTLTKAAGIPGSAGQFFYDSGTDVLYAWLPDGSNPNGATYLMITGWVPCVDEVLLNTPVGAGWVTRRLCHHRCRSYPPDFGTNSLSHPDREGRFVLFGSNWDVYNGRVDAFLVDGATAP